MAQRGAQPGNCNAAKNKAACRAKKGRMDLSRHSKRELSTAIYLRAKYGMSEKSSEMKQLRSALNKRTRLDYGKSPHASYGKGWYSKNRGYRRSTLGNRLRTMRNTYEKMGRKALRW